MSVFEARYQLQRDTRFLYLIFTLLLVLFFCVSGLVGAKIAAFSQGGKFFYFSEMTLISSLTLISTFLAMYFSKLADFGKGEKIAKRHGALEVTGNINNPYYKIYNQLVTETAIALGTVTPRIYFIPFESSINAFAAGNSPEDAIIVVNEGALEKLTTHELHALIAHEMSHIIHYDTRFNAHLSSIVYSMMGISILGKSIIHYTQGSQNNSHTVLQYLNPLFYIGCAVLLFGNLFSWSGQLVQSRIAQKREYLADSESVRALRNNSGIISLLNKINIDNQKVKTTSHHQEYSHFYFFANRLLFPSHPSISQRIRAIHATGVRHQTVQTSKSPIKERIGVNVRATDASLTKLIQERVIYQKNRALNKNELQNFTTFYELDRAGLYTPLEPAQRKLTFEQKLSGFIPDASTHNIVMMNASDIFTQIPETIKSVIYNPSQIEFLLYALILEDNAPQQKLQLAHFKPLEIETITTLHKEVINSSEKVYTYILFEMIFPVLRTLDYAVRTKILNQLNRMLGSKAELSIQQFCISYTLNNTLNDMNLVKRKVHKTITRAQLYELTYSLFSIIAHKMSHYEDSDERDIHLITAMRKIYPSTKRRALTIDPNWQVTLKKTLDDFQKVPLEDKEKIIHAVLYFIKLDQKVTPAEYDVIRLISYRLGIPLSLDLQLVERHFPL